MDKSEKSFEKFTSSQVLVQKNHVDVQIGSMMSDVASGEEISLDLFEESDVFVVSGMQKIWQKKLTTVMKTK